MPYLGPVPRMTIITTVEFTLWLYVGSNVLVGLLHYVFVRLKKIQQKKKIIKARAELEAKLRQAAMEADDSGTKVAGMCTIAGLYTCLMLNSLAIVISQVPRLYLMQKKMKIYYLND